jgi:hypothetical protein
MTPGIDGGIDACEAHSTLNININPPLKRMLRATNHLPTTSSQHQDKDTPTSNKQAQHSIVLDVNKSHHSNIY